MAKQVLIIDDDQSVRKHLSAALKEHGFDPITASNGDEGLAEVERASPDLIVLDVMMPKKSGLVLFGQLKEHEQHKDIPILMLTGVGHVLEEMESDRSVGAETPHDTLRVALETRIRELRLEGQVRPDLFLDKPVESDVFIDKVRQLIGS